MSTREEARSVLGATLAEIPEWIRVWGTSGWLLTGIAVAVGIGAWLLAETSSISVPLLLAAVLGIVFEPLVGALERRRVPRALGATIVMVLVALTVSVIGVLIARGLIDQWGNISTRLEEGLRSFETWLASIGVNVGWIIQHGREMLQPSDAQGGSSTLGSASTGVFGAVRSGITSTGSFLSGLFIAVVLLFYVLEDYPRISAWTSRHMFGLKESVGRGLIDDASVTLRAYVRGTTISGFFVALLISIGALILHVPLVIAIFTVTFVTCYIPFFGAIISALFAFVIALGGTGLTQALILLLIVLLAQNVLQTVINAKIMGDALELHPLVVLVVTILGGIFGGLLGTTLGAPVTALAIKARRRLAAARRNVAALAIEDADPPS
jgi:predicted PurR-regulated permease PerM